MAAGGLKPGPRVIRIPWHAHVPDPAFLLDLEGKRIMFDVGTLIRAILFQESHSSRLLEHIEASPGAKAIICSHVRDKAIFELRRHQPGLVENFASGLLAWVARGAIEEAPNGDPQDLPAGVSFDPKDDDIVIATAMRARCDSLATLDPQCAHHAGSVLDILPPSQPECNRFFSTAVTIDVPIFAGDTEGFLQLAVLPHAGADGAGNHRGRRYIFSTEGGLAFWLSDVSGRFEVGVHDVAEPIWQFPEMPLDRTCLIAASYDCVERRLIVGCSVGPENEPIIRGVPARLLPPSLGNKIDILSRGELGSFRGNWRGVLSARKFLGERAIRFALQHKCHFEPLDAQRHRLEDARFEAAVTLVPDGLAV